LLVKAIEPRVSRRIGPQQRPGGDEQQRFHPIDSEAPNRPPQS
jgi:hypothetical protein